MMTHGRLFPEGTDGPFSGVGAVIVLGLFAMIGLGCQSSPARGPRHPDPWLGEQRALVLLLSWQDAAPTLSREQVTEDFFGSVGSLSAWFREASQGRFTLTGEVLDWRQASARWADQDIKKPGVVVRLAREAFAEVLDIEAYDGTGNGRIDHLFVVHSGRLSQDRIGPRAMFVPGLADRSVVIQSQGVGGVGQQLALGFYLHEAGHRWFDEGDQYGEHRRGDYGIGTWGLMGLGQWGPHAGIARDALFRRPVHPRAAVKARLGWVEVQTVTADT